MLTVVSRALERREKVVDILVDSATEQEAAERLVAALGVADPSLAQVVVDLQLRRLTQDDRAALEQDIRELTADLSDT